MRSTAKTRVLLPAIGIIIGTRAARAKKKRKTKARRFGAHVASATHLDIRHGASMQIANSPKRWRTYYFTVPDDVGNVDRLAR